ncbi:MAG TPA: SUF system NifU family Fe-S cluster assembly protein [Woeseiaceae bacterium]|nr:SUF system NifU family Fe-S cluster assembly protein [Woeseiaceae bacterium]
MTPSAFETDELRELYRELILDHARSPRHFGRLDDATHSAEGINPLCGDKLKIYVAIDADNRIRDARFEGSGCAISVASASLLTETVIGLDTNRALQFFAAMVSRLAGRSNGEGQSDTIDDIDLGKLRALEGVREFPSRVKCATLAWHALNSALKRKAVPASTE